MTEIPKKKPKDPIGEALGLPPQDLSPVETQISVLDQLLIDAHDDSAKKDFEKARSTLYDVIDDGQDAMSELSVIAKQSQHPRAFEVYATLMNVMITASEKLLTLQTKIREIKDSDKPNAEQTKISGNITQNNLYVGSTSELNRLLRSLKEDSAKIIEASTEVLKDKDDE